MKIATQPTALVVNDDPFQLRLATGLLEKDGFQVRSCPSAEEALRTLEKHGPVDIIVTDVHMPGIDGWRFCQLLRSPDYLAFNTVPILVTSATFSGAQAAQVSVDLGANAFLPVPYTPSALRAHVRTLLERRKPQLSLRVLIVEPSEGQANVLRCAFEEHGYTVYVAQTGSEGLHLFGEHAPAMVILDDQLPDMTGDQLLTACKRPDAPTVAILTTSDPTPELALQFMRLGADGYVRKPFDPEYLIIGLCT